MPLSRHRKQQPSQRLGLWTTVWSSGHLQLHRSHSFRHATISMSMHCRLQRPEWLRNGCTCAVQKDSAPLNCLLHMTHSFRHGLTGTVQTQEQGGAGGAQPLLNRSHNIMYNFNASCSAGSAPFLVVRRITPYLFVLLKALEFSYLLIVQLSSVPPMPSSLLGC
jgi:hypothetical protein